MDILVSDTNIFIDLWNCGLIHKLFELPYEIHTVDFVLNELTDLDQRRGMMHYSESGRLVVKSLVDGDELGNVLIYKSEKAAGTNLSIADCAILCYTKELNEAKLLTGDKRLRSQAKKEGLDVSGIFFLIDLFIESGVLTEKEALQDLYALQASNPRLPKEEFDKRIEKWRIE